MSTPVMGSKIEAVFFDGDGTAWDHGAQFPEQELVESLSTLEVPAFLVTGRSLTDARSIVSRLGLPEVAISGGARLVNVDESGNLNPSRYDRFPIHWFRVFEVLDYLGKEVPKIEGAKVQVPSWEELLGPVFSSLRPQEHVDSIFVRDIPRDRQARRLARKISRVFGDGLSIATVIAQDPELVDIQINDRNGNKAAAVTRLALKNDLDLHSCLAVGDGNNDVGMFDVVGQSVAMGNASSKVKSAADHVIGTQAEGAFLDLLASIH